MKILFINSLFHPEVGGGAEVVLRNLAVGMNARGHRVSVVCTAANGPLRVESFDGVRVWRFGIRNLYPLYPPRRHGLAATFVWRTLDLYNARSSPLIRDVLRRESPDVVCVQNLKGISVSAWAAVRDHGTAMVQVLNDLDLLGPSRRLRECPPRGGAGLVRRLVCFPHRRLSGHVTAVVALSHSVLTRYREAGYFPGVPAHVIPTGLAIPDPGLRERPTVDRPLRIGYLGRLCPSKGVEHLLAGFVEASELAAELRVSGEGDPGYVQSLRRRFPDARVTFLGRSVPEEFFASIDVCVVPSQAFDTLPTVIIEAGAYRVPVVAAPVGGIPEMIQEGRNGFLMDMATVRSTAQALRRIAAFREQLVHLRGTAREAIARFLDSDAQLAAYEAVFQAAQGAGRDGVRGRGSCPIVVGQAEMGQRGR